MFFKSFSDFLICVFASVYVKRSSRYYKAVPIIRPKCKSAADFVQASLSTPLNVYAFAKSFAKEQEVGLIDLGNVHRGVRKSKTVKKASDK